jgi:hypothetical protein
MYTRLLYSLLGFPPPPSPACLKPLGVENGKIPNSQMSASSVWDVDHGAENGRLHFQKNGRKTGAWSALRNNAHQWLGVDFGKIAKVTRVSTQSRHDYNQWVTSYTLEYSLDGAVFNTYEVRRRAKVRTITASYRYWLVSYDVTRSMSIKKKHDSTS